MSGDERRKRMIQLGTLAVFLGAVVIAVLIAVSQSGSDSGTDSGGDTAVEGSAEVDAQLKGLDQDGLVLGDPKAAVTITEFGDLQCPVCAQYALELIPALIEDQVRTGRAKLEFRNWVIVGPQSVDAANASLAASEQGRYWSFIELFYRNQGMENSGYVSDDFLRSIAEGAGVPDIDRWSGDLGDPRWSDQIAADDAEAKRLGFQGTPSFLVEGPGGSKPLGTVSANEIGAAVDAVSR